MGLRVWELLPFKPPSCLIPLYKVFFFFVFGGGLFSWSVYWDFVCLLFNLGFCQPHLMMTPKWYKYLTGFQTSFMYLSILVPLKYGGKRKPELVIHSSSNPASYTLVQGQIHSTHVWTIQLIKLKILCWKIKYCKFISSFFIQYFPLWNVKLKKTSTFLQIIIVTVEATKVLWYTRASNACFS